MSTRSLIAIEMPNKENPNKLEEIQYVYCHFDGYISQGVGEQLHLHYNTREKVQELISKGGMSSLASTIEETDFYSDEQPADIHTIYSQYGLTKIGKKSVDFIYLFSLNNEWLVSKFIYPDMTTPFKTLSNYFQQSM